MDPNLLIYRNCSATKDLCSSLQMVTEVLIYMPSSLLNVVCSIVSAPCNTKTVWN